VSSGGTGAAVRGGALNVAGSLVSMVLNLALVVLVAREYGAAGSGVFFGAIALFTIIGTTVKLGSETGLVFSISRFRAKERWADVVPTINLALWPVLALSAAVSLLLVAGADLIPGAGQGTVDGDFAGVMRGLMPFLPAFVAVQVITGATRGYGTMLATVRDTSVLRPLYQAVLMAVVVAHHDGLVMLAVAWGLPMALTTVTAVISLIRLVRQDPSGGEPSPGLRREFWAYSSVRGFAQTLQTTQDRIGVVVVGAVAGPAVAGVFVVVARLIGGLNLIIYSVGQAMNPEISSLLARGDRPAAERMVQRMTAWTMLLVWPIAILLITHGDVVLSLFGAEFIHGSAALELLSLAMIICTAFGHLDNVLLMGGRARLSLYNVGGSLVLMVALYTLLTPRWELMGAAWAWAIGLLAYNLGPWPYVRRSLGIRGLGPEALYVLPSAIGILCAASFGRVILGDSWPATLLTWVVAGVVGLIAVRQYVVPLHLAELGGFLKPGRAKGPLSTEGEAGTTGSDQLAAVEEAG
jgi:O-antigen/teichoic acid export membrane protein